MWFGHPCPGKGKLRLELGEYVFRSGHLREKSLDDGIAGKLPFVQGAA